MVGGAKDPSRQPSAEDEAVKRNTDCVYFLASPLTCKKGSECEYRHSEPARLNPRDCWFWLNGNCLNPKCSYRHPPLDGLLGTQAATAPAPAPAAQSSVPQPLPLAVAPAANTLSSAGKQAVPCIFFQKGLCLKGDRCSFLHGTNPPTNKAPQARGSNPSTETLTNKKAFGGLEKCSQIPKVPPQVNNAKPSVLSAKPEMVAPKFGVYAGKSVQPSRTYGDELPRNKAVVNIPAATNGNSTIRPSNMHQTHVLDDRSLQGSRDADDFLKESSPGFDVLVDDELQDSDYYHDEVGRSRGHEGRSLTSRNEHDLVQSGDYNSMSDLDREYRDPRGYDSYEGMQYAWEQRRASSSERMAVGSVNQQRRGYARDGSPSPDDIDGSDLRYRLSKQRRTNGLRSVINTDYVHDKDAEERSYGGSYRDSHHLPPPQESSLSSRLRGRIVLPGSSSPVNGSDLHLERDTDRVWNRSRLPVGRQPVSKPHGRLRDRIKGRAQEDFNEGRNVRGLGMRRDSLDERSASVTDFAGPKSLAELKGEKNPERKERQNKGRQPFSHLNQQSDGDLSFEGPMPLSVILKRKRESETAGSTSLGNKEDNEGLINDSSKTSELESQGFPSFEPEKLPDSQVLKNKKQSNTTTSADGLVPSEKAQSNELEDGIVADDAGEDHNLESYDRRDRDSDFEQVEGGDYNEGENVDPEEEYLDDEDGDDFAKRIGVMFS
ncbi:Zinc finger, CCCH-type [Dillenia turbinata]|uniref:Zinc finger, CCCH-type n=1 Tax=Dillenia turbinata TaxID=194707 RepID=A0AAN8UVM2_9MAGN